MLKSASCLLDEFKTGRKAEPEVKVTVFVKLNY